MSESLWWITKDGDADCLAMYQRHYSAHHYADGRTRKLFCGPGEKLILRTWNGDAMFVWRKFFDACIDERTGLSQEGVNCAVFRNENRQKYDSKELILQACAVAYECWPSARCYTYVDEKRVASKVPGACFISAGWRYAKRGKHRLRTKSGLLILETRKPTLGQLRALVRGLGGEA